jgi:hypothetical protein
MALPGVSVIKLIVYCSISTCPTQAGTKASGDSDPALIKKLIHDGASAYLVKGKDDLDPSSLVRVIETAITNHAVLNKLDMAAIDTQSIRKEIGQ